MALYQDTTSVVPGNRKLLSLKRAIFPLRRIEYSGPVNVEKITPTLSETPLETEQAEAAEHHSVYCPNCSDRLYGHRCKLICRRCGYYLSCADYY
jgi:hypothetical protein